MTEVVKLKMEEGKLCQAVRSSDLGHLYDRFSCPNVQQHPRLSMEKRGCLFMTLARAQELAPIKD